MITYEIEKLDELRKKFDPKLIDKALDRALQSAAMKMRTRISKEARVLYNVKAGDISKTVRIHKLRSPPGRLLLYQGRMIGLDKFGARPKVIKTARGRRVGATVLVRKDRGRKLVSGAFIANVHGAKVFERAGDKRLPIERKYGPSIAHMVGNKFVEVVASQHAGEDAATEFNRYLEYLMTKA